MLRSIPALLLVFVLVAACTDVSVTGNESIAARPQLNFLNGPPAPGQSGIFRFEGTDGFFVFDAERGLMSLHGNSTPIAELCTGSPPVWDPVDVQVLFSPTGAIPALQTGDQTVFVYETDEFDCAKLLTAPLVASGVTRLVRTDNDLLGFGGPGANAFGWNATGVLTSASGDPIHYTEVVRLVVHPFTDPGGDEVEEVSVSIRLFE